MNETLIGLEMTQWGSKEGSITHAPGLEWSEPPTDGAAMTWAFMVLSVWGLQISHRVLRAYWVPVASAETLEYALSFVCQDDDGCLHAALVVQLG